MNEKLKKFASIIPGVGFVMELDNTIKHTPEGRKAALGFIVVTGAAVALACAIDGGGDGEGEKKAPRSTPLPILVDPDADPGNTGQAQPTAAIPLSQVEIQRIKINVNNGLGCPESTKGLKISGTDPNGERVVCQSP